MAENRPVLEENFDASPEDSPPLVSNTTYIRVGQHGCAANTSSPVLSCTDQYVWNFLNWGFSTAYSIKQFSDIRHNQTDIVPFANMDQGRLFVRVSMQDLCTLQLAYQKGIEALEKSQAKVSRLQTENQRLEIMVKNWSSRTASLSSESQQLKHEIINMKRLMNARTLPLESFDNLLSNLCRRVCDVLTEHASASLINQSPTFEDTVSIISSLPSELHDRLMTKCPKFNEFISSADSGTYAELQLRDAKARIDRIFSRIPSHMGSSLVSSILNDYNQNYSTEEQLSLVRGRCHSEPAPDVAREDNSTQYELLPPSKSNSFQQQDIIEDFSTTLSDEKIWRMGSSDKTDEQQHHSETTSSSLLQAQPTLPLLPKVITTDRNSCTSSTTPSFGFTTPLAQSTPCGTLGRSTSRNGQLMNMSDLLATASQTVSNKMKITAASTPPSQKSGIVIRLPKFPSPKMVRRRKKYAVVEPTEHNSGKADRQPTKRRKLFNRITCGCSV